MWRHRRKLSIYSCCRTSRKCIISNFFSIFKKKISYNNFSWVTYTDPEIATFGLNEEHLQERNIKYQKIEENIINDDRSIIENSNNGKIILYISKKRIIGGTLIAKNAGEIVQELVLANSSNLDIKHIFNKIYPYPTASRINKRIISNHFGKKLTSGVKRLLKVMY